MTREQLVELKPGDTVRDIDNGNIMILIEGYYNISNFKGSPLIHIATKEDEYANTAWLPYFYYELELIYAEPKCTCDIMTIMQSGCRCGGS